MHCMCSTGDTCLSIKWVKKSTHPSSNDFECLFFFNIKKWDHVIWKSSHIPVTQARMHLWPISWAMVKATGKPESSLMLQLRCGWHIPERWDRPKVSQGWFIPAQMSFLGVQTQAKEHLEHLTPFSNGILYVCVCLAWWPTQPGHNGRDVCHSVDLSSSARHRSWSEWCLHGGRSLGLSVYLELPWQPHVKWVLRISQWMYR